MVNFDDFHEVFAELPCSSRALEFIMDGEDDNDVPEHHPRAQALQHSKVGA